MSEARAAAEKAIRSAEATIAGCEILINFAKARTKIMGELPDGWVRDKMLDGLEFQTEFALQNLNRPRYTVPGEGVTVGINLRKPAP